MTLRLKMRSAFPASVSATTPITVEKTGGAYVFGFDPNYVLNGLQGEKGDQGIQGIAGTLADYTAPGTGGVARGANSIFDDLPFSAGWDTGTHAASEILDGTVFVAAGDTPTLPATFPGTTFEYLSQTNMKHFNDGDVDTQVQRLFRSQPLSGTHIGKTWGAVGIESRPSGSGGAGDSSDVGLLLSVQKQDWGASAQTGQIVGHYAHVQNDGPGSGASNDASAYLFDLIGVHTSGYYSAVEGNVFIYNTDRSTIRKGMFVQMGVSDSRTTDRMFGLILGTSTGIMDKGVLIQTIAGTSCTNPFEYATEHGERWQVNGSAQMLVYPANGTGSEFFYISNGGGSFQLINTAGSTAFLSVDQAGIILLNGTQVLETRRTGWNNPSGTLTRGTFTVGGTLTDTQEHLAALITDLRSHGLIGT